MMSQQCTSARSGVRYGLLPKLKATDAEGTGWLEVMLSSSPVAAARGLRAGTYCCCARSQPSEPLLVAVSCVSSSSMSAQTLHQDRQPELGE
jgi:hypothetical protein